MEDRIFVFEGTHLTVHVVSRKIVQLTGDKKGKLLEGSLRKTHTRQHARAASAFASTAVRSVGSGSWGRWRPRPVSTASG